MSTFDLKTICNDCRQIIWVNSKQEGILRCTPCSFQRIIDKREVEAE